MNNKFQKYIDENFINTVTELVIEWPEGVDDVTISSPLRPDEKPSFSINKQGLWFDHATEEKGDLVSLICMLEDVPKEEAERLIIERGEINPSDFCEFDKPTTEINTFPANRISAIQDQKKYLYTNENGDILFIVGRTDTNQGKKIRPYYYDQEADKIKTGNPLKSARPLYKLHELIPTDKPVLLVEGEKCAEIEVEGYFTTTWAQGCASWKKTDFAPLGNRKVFLCHHNS